MPRYSKTDFAAVCGVTTNYLKQYVRRGKVVVGDDNLIDDKLPMNRDFKNQRTGETAQIKKKPLPSDKNTRYVAPSEQKDRTAEELNKYNLDLQIKNLAIEKAEQEVELNKIKIAKLNGTVIPTDLVKVVIAQHSKSITTSFHQGCDNFIMTIAKISGMNREDVAKLRGELIGIVNQSVKDSIKISKENLENIIDEYSQQRGRGEKL